MCGFSGWIDWKQDLKVQSSTIEAMTECLANRGPDGEGYYISPHALLGHQRLVVVDPVGGAQPMQRTHRGRTCTIVYNGELYNTDELRRELKYRGWKFQTRNSDTETLLLAYMEWGSNCLSRLNGIFAFAVWEHESERLFMARDRLGVKPLFYCHIGYSLIFGSEIKSLLAHPQIKPVLDEKGLAELLVMAPSRTPGQGVFKNIKELRPGWSLGFSREGLQLEQYWKLRSEPFNDDPEACSRTVAEIFRDAVYRQTRADVPVAVFLSGGLDSSAVTALTVPALKEQGLPTFSFSVDYAGNQDYFSSTAYQQDADFMWVEQAANSLGSRHQSVVLSNRELAGSLLPAMKAADYPAMADIDGSLLLFCQEVKKYATVALSGECADEIFGGYPWFHWEDRRDETFPWIRAVDERLALISPGLSPWLTGFCRDYLNERYQEAVREVPVLEGESGFDAHKRLLFYICLTRFMPTLLDRKDRMSMACGLEVRVPFADHRLLEYVWNVPWDIKNWGGEAKGLLRRALQGVVPEFILQRPKSPYPKTHNPEYLYLVKIRAEQITRDEREPLGYLLNASTLKDLLNSGRQLFSRPWFGQLMGDAQYFAWLIQLNAWLKDYSVQIEV
ncbi:MAG: asparagine synthase (glutamine-hydrolyzing) [Syntrophomonadaceae bacterium]